MSQHLNIDLYLFDEALPDDFSRPESVFKSECVPDKKIKVEDLFQFKRRVGDYQVSVAALAIALFFLVFFFTQTGWQDRKLPDNVGSYFAHQIGLIELDGRVTRFGRILKQSWVIPMLCLALLVPAALWNWHNAYAVNRQRKRFQLPTDARYEYSQYLRALEFVAYFILYTLMVPVLGYLLSTVLLGSYLTFRLGYRSPVWIARSLATSIVIVLVFRTLLQIKTPLNIWLYDLLPTDWRSFMLTYF